MIRISTKLIATVLCVLMLCTAIPFSALAAPSYWGYDSYTTIENPGITNITSYATTLTKNSATKYSMSCTTDAGKLTVTLEEKSWGMFNLGSWTLVDKNGKTITFLSASTDWEYVYRTCDTSTGNMVWSGGNHGNEVLVSLDFYNGDSGEKLNLAVGQSVTANKIHIIEKSQLLFKKDTDGDGYGYRYKSSETYSSSDVYANATRKYTITGPQIMLNVDYDYIKDVYYQLSYTCMFPIDKQYGLYCDMYDTEGNKIKHIETLKVGAADYSGKQYSGNAASRAHIYGYVDQRYQFNVFVNTLNDSVENFKNAFKTSYWDMNTTSNKIYFSKYNTNSYTKISAGTESHTECGWQFVFDENGIDGSDDTTQLNLARDKGYTISVTNDPVKTDSVSYAAKLTDGVAANSFSYKDDSWFCLSKNQNAVDGVTSITVDLGATYNVKKLRLHLGNFSGVNAPTTAKAYAKIDGNYTYIGDFPLVTTAETAYWTKLDVTSLNTDSIKLDFALNGTLGFINEIEVHGDNAIKIDNVALRKPYTTAGVNSSYPDENGITLTDGVIAPDDALYSNQAYVGYNTNSDEYKANGYMAITVDLGKSYSLNKFVGYVASSFNSDAGVVAPATMSVYVSDDNAKWTLAGETNVTDNSAVSCIPVELTLDSYVDAQYVQYRFTPTKNWVMIAEVEAYKTFVPISGENLALNKDYTTTAPNRGDKFNDDQIRLTNGVKGTTNADSTEYAGWNYTNPNGVDIIVDLGETVYSDTYTAYFVGGNWGIALASEYIWIEVFVSDTEDGEYVSVAKTAIGDAVLTNGTGVADDTWSTYVITAQADSSVSGRFVKFHLNHTGPTPSCMWIDEVEVYQVKAPATEPEPDPTLMGDVNFDGKVDSLDYLIVKRSCFQTYTLSIEEKAVADLNGDNDVTSVDYLLVKRIAFDTYVTE